jgi:hypothetical protein
MISLKLADTFGDDAIFVSEFLRAGRRWASTFCDNWENQLKAAEKEVEFFKTTRAYRNVVLKESGSASIQTTISRYANAVILQSKTSDQSDQKSKDHNPKTGDNPSKKGARKCVCEDIHEFRECSYIVSSARTSDWTEDKKILDQIKQQLQEKPWILNILKRICNINLLDWMFEKRETLTSSTEMEGNLPSFRFGNFSFANTVIRDINPLIKSVIYDSGCSDPLTFDKNRFLGEIKPVSKDTWIKTPNGRMKVEGYGTMQVLGKSGDKQIRMEFANTAYVLITSMTLVSSTKLIKEGYDRDMHTKTLVHVATGKKVCDIEEHFGVMTLEYVKYEATVDLRNEMENMASINLTNGSTATVEKTAPNEVLNETSNKKIEMLNNQASTKEKEVEKTPQPITNSESVSVPITHGKSDTEPHIMELNQSDKGQQNPSLNNPHSSRQIDSGGGGHFTKAPNSNGGPKGRFTKASNLKNGSPQKHECLKQANPIITNQKVMRKPTIRTQIGPQKHGGDPQQLEFKLPPQMELKNGRKLKNFQVVRLDFRSMAIKACNTRSS